MNLTKPCQGCRTSAVQGVLIFGPVLGVWMIEACPRCQIVRSHADAAILASSALNTPAFEQHGHWYIDQLDKDQVEPLIVQDLESRRERALATPAKSPWE